MKRFVVVIWFLCGICFFILTASSPVFSGPLSGPDWIIDTPTKVLVRFTGGALLPNSYGGHIFSSLASPSGNWGFPDSNVLPGLYIFEDSLWYPSNFPVDGLVQVDGYFQHLGAPHPGLPGIGDVAPNPNIFHILLDAGRFGTGFAYSRLPHPARHEDIFTAKLNVHTTLNHPCSSTQWGDVCVDVEDVSGYTLEVYGRHADPATPEPSTLLLLGSGVAGLFGLRRKGLFKKV